MRPASLLLASLLLSALSGAPGLASAGPRKTPASSPEGLSLRVRDAVAAGDDAALYRLADEDPWGFREVTQQLADLAVSLAGPGEVSEEAVTRLVVAGHLAAIHLDESEDPTLAERIRTMARWTAEQMGEHSRIDALLSRLDGSTPPSVAELAASLAVSDGLGDARQSGLIHAAIAALRERHDDPDGAIEEYGRAAERFRAGGEMRRLRDAQLARGQVLLRLRRPVDAAAAFDSAAAISAGVGEPEAQVGSLLLLAEALIVDDRREEAFRPLTTARRVALAAKLPALAARAILLRVALRDQGSDSASSLEDYLAAARLAEEGGDRATVARAYRAAAHLFVKQRRDAAAAEVMEKALAAARLSGIAEEVRETLIAAADTDSRMGQAGRAIRRLEEAARLSQAAGDPVRESIALQQLGTVLLETGDLEGATTRLERAADLAGQQGLIGVQGTAEGTLGAVLLKQGDTTGAKTHYRQAIDLLERAGDRVEAERMRLVLKTLP